MAEQMRPASKEESPDPSNSYERSHPERESGMGRLDNNSKATPTPKKDKMPTSVTQAQDGSRQLNAHENDQKDQPQHSKKDEEPLGWNQTPNDGSGPKKKKDKK